MSRKAVLVVLAVNAAALAALAAWAAAGWAGSPPNHLVAENAYYCEALRGGWIKQPANTWSCLGFVVVGLVLAARARSRRGALLALLISLIGPGSMALHASMTKWGGALDVATMYLFIGFAAAHDAARLHRPLDEGFAPFYGAVACACAFLAATTNERGPLTFAALIAAFVAAEAVVALKGAAPGRDRRLLAASAALFFAGFGFWLASRTPDGPICSPTSLLQGHAAWHLLCALAAGAIFLYLEPELAPAAAPGATNRSAR